MGNQQPSRLDQHWKTMRKSQSNPHHLTHADLFDAVRSKAEGRDVYKSPVVKIVDVSIELVKSAEKPNGEELIYLQFERVRKKLGLNSTNSATIEKLTGRGAPGQWIGTTIQLYVDPQAKYPKGQKGPAIRIRPTAPKGAAEAAPLPDVPAEDHERLEKAKEERLEREPGEEG